MENNKIYLKYALFLLLIILSFSQLTVSQTKLKLLTFNIWDPGDKVYWDKLGGYPVDSLIKYLTEDDADMIMLQEVTLEAGIKNQVYARVKKRLEAKGYLYSAFYRPDYSKGAGIVGYIQGMENSGYPLAIFSKFPVCETFAVQTMNKKTMHKGVLGLRIQFNNKTLYVFNTHLGIGSPHTDEEVDRVVIPFVNRVAGNDAVIIIGDWNCPSAMDYPKADKEIGKYRYSASPDKFILDDGFVDAYRIMNKDINLLKDATYPEDVDFMQRIDRVYIRNTDLVPVKTKVKKNFWKQYDLSDHRGVFIEFDLN